MPLSSWVDTVSLISPCLVNFTALFSRLPRIWRKRVGSPMMNSGTLFSIVYARFRPFLVALVDTRSRASSTLPRNSKGCSSSMAFSRPIFEKSRISLMMTISASPLILMVSMKSLCSGFRSSSSKSREVMPITAFMGVRISWLILAMKSDLAWVAASAASFALNSSCSTRLLSVMSRPTPMMATTFF